MAQYITRLIISLSCALPLVAQAVVIYVYEDNTGVRILSNLPISKNTHTFIKKYEPSVPIQSLKENKSKRVLQPRESKFDQTIFNISDTYGQDPALMKAIVHVESSFNPNAVSSKGAQGLMQLMPLTAKQYNVKKPFDAVENLRAGIQHFSAMMQQFDQNIGFSLAAYNAGATAVINYQGIPPYPETKAYVNNILHLQKGYQRIVENNVN